MVERERGRERELKNPCNAASELPLIQVTEIRTPYKHLTIKDMTSRSLKTTLL